MVTTLRRFRCRLSGPRGTQGTCSLWQTKVLELIEHYRIVACPSGRTKVGSFRMININLSRQNSHLVVI